MLSLTQIVGGFEKLLARLPGTIRKPVEREWRPIQELFFKRRAPRLLVFGESGAASDWFQAAFQVGQGDVEVEAGPWLVGKSPGKLEFVIAGTEQEACAAILSAEADIILYFAEKNTPQLDPLRALHACSMRRYAKVAPIIAVTENPLPLQEAVNADGTLRLAVETVLDPSRREAILAAIGQRLPVEARLEFARASGEKSAQLEIAAMLTRSLSAVCAAVGAQPIPLADFPILTSLQVLMVAGIIHATGREWSLRLARDFLGALGANVGVGLLLREGTRAVVKLLPGWGNAISGAVAGAGTYAIGRAASAYFIEGLSMTEARRRFRRSKKEKRSPQLPG